MQIIDRKDHLQAIEDAVRTQYMQRIASVLADIGMQMIQVSQRISVVGDPNPEYARKQVAEIASNVCDDWPVEFIDVFGREADSDYCYYADELERMEERVKEHVRKVVMLSAGGSVLDIVAAHNARLEA